MLKNKVIFLPVVLIFLFVSLLSQVSYSKELIYHYIEGENFQEEAGSSFREEGFTYWMGHPSGGKVVLPSGYTKYNLSDLKDGEYYVFIKQLAFKSPQASVEVLINNNSVGITEFDKPGTYLAWSKRIGPFKKEGETYLKLKPAPGNRQASYVDVLLITNDAGYVPVNVDQDFKSVIKKDAGIVITGFSISGHKDKCNLKIKLESKENIKGKCFFSAGFIEKDLYGSKTFKTTADVKKGLNEIFINCPGLKQTDYSLNITVVELPNILIAEKSQKITAKDFPLYIEADNYFYLAGDIKGQIKVKINDAEISGKAKYFNFRIKDKTAPVRVPAVKSAGAYEYDLTKLDPGKYIIGIDVLDQNKKTLMSADSEFTKTSLNASIPVLEDIKQVSIKDRHLEVNGKPFVVRKLYHADGGKYVKEQGFSVVDCWAARTLEDLERMLNYAHKNNLYGYGCLFHPYFYKGDDKGFDLEALRIGINKLKNHPALLMWELFDEPELSVPVKYLKQAYAVIKEVDPNHPVLLNFCRPDKFREYAVAADVVSYDVYPVPARPLIDVSDYANKLDAAVDSKKPLQAVLQTYCAGKGRMPTPDELRCMTYLAINHGIKTLSFYSYSEGKGYPYCLADDPFMWSYMRCFNAELESIKDVIVALPARLKVTSSSDSIDLSARKVGDNLFVIAVNKDNKDSNAVINIESPSNFKEARVLFEGRTIVPKKSVKVTSITETFKPYEVHVYTFPKKPN